MHKLIIVVLFVLSHLLNVQTTDYNTQKGFVAEGYDVVSYFDNTATKGNNKYIATYDGAKFRFFSQENLDTFHMNPTNYIPQYGGYCAYAVAVKTVKVSIDPETFEIRNGKLFLFYNSWGVNTLKSWEKEFPDALKIKADENWISLNQKD